MIRFSILKCWLLGKLSMESQQQQIDSNLQVIFSIFWVSKSNWHISVSSPSFTFASIIALESLSAHPFSLQSAFCITCTVNQRAIVLNEKKAKSAEWRHQCNHIFKRLWPINSLYSLMCVVMHCIIFTTKFVFLENQIDHFSEIGALLLPLTPYYTRAAKVKNCDFRWVAKQ